MLINEVELLIYRFLALKPKCQKVTLTDRAVGWLVD